MAAQRKTRDQHAARRRRGPRRATSRGTDPLRATEQERRERDAPQRLGADDRRDDAHRAPVERLEQRHIRDPTNSPGQRASGRRPAGAQRTVSRRTATNSGRDRDRATRASRRRRSSTARRCRARGGGRGCREARTGPRRAARTTMPIRRTCAGRSRLARERQPAADDQAARRRGRRHRALSSSTTTAITTANSGAMPKATDARAEPASRMPERDEELRDARSDGARDHERQDPAERRPTLHCGIATARTTRAAACMSSVPTLNGSGRSRANRTATGIAPNSAAEASASRTASTQPPAQRAAARHTPSSAGMTDEADCGELGTIS